MLEIRTARWDDIVRLADLASRTYQDAFGSTFSPEELAKRLRETRSAKYFAGIWERDRLLVAEDGRELVGYAQIGPVTNEVIEKQPSDRELQRLFVQSTHQRRGIGSSLLNAVLEDPRLPAEGKIYLDVWEKNQAAIRLYKRYGFIETSLVIDGDVTMVRANRPF